MTFSVDDFLGEFEAPTVEVPVCPRADLLEEHRRLDRELAEAGKRGDIGGLAGSGTRQLAEQVRDLETQIEGATRTFRFRALSRRRWLALQAQHPPSKADKADGWGYNPETLPVAAIAACAVEPTMTEEQAGKLADLLPLGEFSRIWVAVNNLNLGANEAPKSVLATAILRTNGASSTTAAPEESLEASS